jgi:hypothetical protein
MEDPRITRTIVYLRAVLIALEARDVEAARLLVEQTLGLLEEERGGEPPAS